MRGKTSKRLLTCCIWMAVLLFPLFTGSAAYAAIYYVTTSGNDVNGCTNSGADACLTVQRAIEVCAASGDTISIGAGTYESAATINPVAKNIVFEGAGITGANLTRLKATGYFHVFTFDNASISSSTVVRNLVIQTTTSFYGIASTSSSASPIIEKNVFLALDGAYAIYAGGAATIKNNIVVGGGYGIYGGATASVINNTVVNTGTYAFLYGNRANNIAYANTLGFGYCDASYTAKHNLAGRNSTNYYS